MQLLPGLIPRTQPLLGPTAIGTDVQVLASDGLGATYWVDMAGGVTDHGALTGLADDDHSQYALLAGRSGGQTLVGGTAAGNTLTLTSTSNATKGSVSIGGTVVLVDSTGVLTLRQTGSVMPATSSTYPFTIFKDNVQNLSIGADATDVYVQTWASKTLNLNAQGNTVKITGQLDITRLDAQRLVMFGSGTSKYGYGVQGGELRAFVPNTASVGHTWGVLSTTDGTTYTPLLTLDKDGGLRHKVFTDATRPTAGVAGRVIYNSTDGNLNIDNGTNWILPNGTVT
jgi:hypothetical protein